MTDPLLSNTSFSTAGEYYQAGTGHIAMPWGTHIRVKYSVKHDLIRVLLPDGRRFSFGTPDAAQGLPFDTSHTYRIKDASDAVLQQFYEAPPIVDGVRLTYTRWGSFVDQTHPPTGDVVTASFFFGIPTADMPVSGLANYSTKIDATGLHNGRIYNFTDDASATFSADFGAGSVSTAVSLKGATVSGGTTVDLGTFNGSGAITGSGFGGTWSGVPGAFEGAFFGPAAAEMGYTFFLDTGSTSASGFVAGRKN